MASNHLPIEKIVYKISRLILFYICVTNASLMIASAKMIYHEKLDKNYQPQPDALIIDVRTAGEVRNKAIFKNAINIPLQDLAGRIAETSTDKPILINCASGYRSAAGSSILKK